MLKVLVSYYFVFSIEETALLSAENTVIWYVVFFAESAYIERPTCISYVIAGNIQWRRVSQLIIKIYNFF